MSMSFPHPLRAFSVGAQASTRLAEKIADDPPTNKTPQSMVTCVYQMHISACWCNVTVLWCKNLMNHSLNLIFNNPDGGEIYYSCKIELKPWLFWSKKGSKSFELEGCHVDVHWDLRSARFSGSPEPSSDYYVALVSEGEVVLMLGDYKKKAYKRTKARPALVDPTLFYKKENWKFRGNQSVMVDKQQVQVLWDVHDWLFNSPGAGHGLFIFKPGAPEPDDDQDGSSHGTGSDASDMSKYFSTISNATPEFCLFLYAWKME
ncbi:hypothetical protein GH714_023891 [Hevea brasiliensis]|uniref:DUF868 domain-containing protein n=1 Tax=Hevea brasiliensis TaxID=3981 RepID=A0A6A6KLX6_HEVBR|nr:hypothetical protein GH714_023891 [Hevea brasiliensis]